MEFDQSIYQSFVGNEITVETDKHTFIGILEDVIESEFLLYNSTCDGNNVGKVYVKNPQSVYCNSFFESIKKVSLENVEDSQYNIRQYSGRELAELARDIRIGNNMIDVPLVRPIDDKYEVVCGHRNLAAARHAGMKTIPVRIMDLNDWGAAQRFVDEYIPLPNDDPCEKKRGLYRRHEVVMAIGELYDEFGDDIIQLDAVRHFCQHENMSLPPKIVTKSDSIEEIREKLGGDECENSSNDDSAPADVIDEFYTESSEENEDRGENEDENQEVKSQDNDPAKDANESYETDETNEVVVNGEAKTPDDDLGEFDSHFDEHNIFSSSKKKETKNQSQSESENPQTATTEKDVPENKTVEDIVYNIIAEKEEESNQGAGIEKVVQAAKERYGLNRSDVYRSVKTLQKQDLVYKPHPAHLQTYTD